MAVETGPVHINVHRPAVCRYTVSANEANLPSHCSYVKTQAK